MGIRTHQTCKTSFLKKVPVLQERIAQLLLELGVLVGLKANPEVIRKATLRPCSCLGWPLPLFAYIYSPLSSLSLSLCLSPFAPPMLTFHER